jgi:Spy/CpxP family protein refolding chaperone
MRFTRFILALLIVGMAFTGFGFVVAQQGPPPQGTPQRGPMGPRMGGPGGPPIPLGLLNLTAEQKDAIQKLLAARRSEEPPRMADLQRKLQEAIYGDTQDLGAIESLKAQIGAAQAEMLKARVDLELQIAQILTPEQKKQVLDAPAAGRGRGRGGMMGRGPGRMMQQNAPGATAGTIKQGMAGL